MKAISVVPSGNWRGSTGPWSTFSLRIGNPPQGVEVLPATSKSNVWVVDPLICPGVQAAGTCRDFRGGLFESQNSTTFNEIITDDDYRELPFLPEQSLGYNGTATFGFDVVGLDLQDGDSAELPNQTISAFAWTTPFLATGLLGLSGEPLDVLGPTDNYSSPLSTLRGANRIPSLFWAYNAGARYLEPRVPASLTVGGYDLNRGGKLEDAFKVPISRSPARDLVVSIQAISIGNGESQEIEPGIDAYIDSVVPDLWLPESICRRFEDAFALQWDETAQLAKVSLTLADPYDKSQTTVISLPFQAFDFDVTWPLAGIQGDSVLHYFPLKRANDSSQYYLGHAFLQEAHLAVDYDRAEFYLSQAQLLSGDDLGPNIKTVYPPGHTSMSTGVIAGIAVGVAVVVLSAAALAAWFLCRPRWKRRRNSRFRERIEAQNFGLPNTQLPSSQETEMQEYYAKGPLSPDSDLKQELDATTTARGSIATRAEMDSPVQSVGSSPRSKMSPRRTSYGFPSSPVELESRSPRMMHSRTASGSSIEPMSPLSGVHRTELGPTEELHELP